MKNDIDDLLNSVFGSRTLRTGGQAAGREKPETPRLTLEPEPKQPSPHGRSPQRRTAPGRPAAPSRGASRKDARPKVDVPVIDFDSIGKQPPGTDLHAAPDFAAIERRAANAARELQALERAAPRTGAALDEAIARQRKEIEALNRSALEDIHRIGRELETPEVRGLSGGSAQEAAAAPLPNHAAPRGKAGLEGFDGLAEALGGTVLGQPDYLQKLVIALKRPYVMGHEGESARNAFLVTGPADTGKHLSLCAAAEELARRGVFVSGDISWMDLSLYPTAAEEKLFLQDLYMALAAKGDIVVFEHYERCQPAFLTVLSNLVQRGKSPLAGRYVLQNGRLVDAGNALVTDAVGALTPRGKYLVLLSEAPVAKLADSFGAPFVSALGDICETAALTPESLSAVAKAEFDKLAARAQKALGFTVTAGDAALLLAAESSGRAKGAQGVLAFWDRAYRALAQYRLEHDDAPKAAALGAADGRLTADFGAGPADLLSLLPEAYQGEVEAVKAELDGIVGLAAVKEYVLSLEDNFAVQARRKAAGLKTASVSMHMIFTGNPGTGKTTIARLVSRYLKAIGVLSGGQLVEVTRADLVGRYVGHTAPLTTQVLKSAVGGVLFIDEAYALTNQENANDFGKEAIEVLLKNMEDHRKDLIVIVAGYTELMGRFIHSNPGLESRFNKYFYFEDYTGDQLMEIFRSMCGKNGYTIGNEAEKYAEAYFAGLYEERDENFGNARDVRNVFERAVARQSDRVAALEAPTKEQLMELTVGDLREEEPEETHTPGLQHPAPDQAGARSPDPSEPRP